MGGFYGSIQVRTEDRGAVAAVVTDIAKSAAIRCLIGPALQGWVGVYPQGAGQDHAVGEAIARQTPGDVLQAVVHDDAVMAYWFWHDGELADAYWSSPGYFKEINRASQEQLSGDPHAFGELLEGQSDQLLKILDRKRDDVAFEAARLQQFAELLGIRNAVTSYEYLKAGERVGIIGWDNFNEVPSEAVAAERAAIRERRKAVQGKKTQLKRDGLLLADAVEDRLLPRAISVDDGFLVAWEGFGRGESRIDLYHAPWDDAEPGEIETGGQMNSVAADALGRRVAMALGNRVVVWESDGWNPILELVEDDWAMLAALSADGRRLAYASRQGIFVHEVDSGKRITALTARDAQTLEFHPGGEWLICAGTAVWIAAVAGKEPWRELYPGGQTPITAEQSQAVKKEMTRVDLDAMERKWRAALDAAIDKLAATGQNSAATMQLVEKMKRQMEKKIAEMHAKFADLKAGKLPPPRHGNESILCGGFARGGKSLWLGSDRGVRLYDWSAVQNGAADSGMPEPVLSYDPAGSTNADGSGGLIYAAAEIPGRDALLFGGYAGRICHWDLKTGDVRELADLPDGGAVVGLNLSADGSAVGVCSRPALGETADKADERAVWQIWSYPALVGVRKKTRMLSPEIMIEE
ncbi:MAG TPA: hypothetical protein VG326_00595 [Tepidisphaeraceae bacterium]|jgi:hypothetical protein|nr:hypothetical protein [Tepidisphaeraceae bacterium]